MFCTISPSIFSVSGQHTDTNSRAFFTFSRPKYKIVLLGDAGVGKSCLALQYADNTFTPNFLSTLGVEFKTKIETVHGKRVKLQIWDTAGQERFRTITESYYRGASGVLLVFDLTVMSSFEHITSWLKEIDHQVSEDYVKVLVGNKTDLPHTATQVSSQEAKDFAAKHSMLYFETSATRYESTCVPFLRITEQIVERINPISQDPALIALTQPIIPHYPDRQGRSCPCRSGS